MTGASNKRCDDSWLRQVAVSLRGCMFAWPALSQLCSTPGAKAFLPRVSLIQSLSRSGASGGAWCSCQPSCSLVQKNDMAACMSFHRFDLVMGYSRELSHMHASYFPHNFSAIRAASTPEHRRRQMWPVDVIASINVTADAVLFVSNCESSLRNDWVQGLMDAMPVDSYGACFKNKQLPLELERQQRLGDRDSAFEAAPGAWRTGSCSAYRLRPLPTAHVRCVSGGEG